jgi:hypothetical protein
MNAKKRVRKEERKAKPAPGPTYACKIEGVKRRMAKTTIISLAPLFLPRTSGPLPWGEGVPRRRFLQPSWDR